MTIQEITSNHPEMLSELSFIDLYSYLKKIDYYGLIDKFRKHMGYHEDDEYDIEEFLNELFYVNENWSYRPSGFIYDEDLEKFYDKKIIDFLKDKIYPLPYHLEQESMKNIDEMNPKDGALLALKKYSDYICNREIPNNYFSDLPKETAKSFLMLQDTKDKAQFFSEILKELEIDYVLEDLNKGLRLNGINYFTFNVIDERK